jgi:hypothetical protein
MTQEVPGLMRVPRRMPHSRRSGRGWMTFAGVMLIAAVNVLVHLLAIGGKPIGLATHGFGQSQR